MHAERYTEVHTVVPSAAPGARPAAEERPRSRAEFVYESVLSELLEGLHPYGVRLREGRLAERFEVSRTPAREALLRLESDGHLVRHDDGGLRPSPPRITGMRDLYELRTALEVAMIRRTALESPGSSQVQALRAAWTLKLQEPGLTDETVDAAFVHVDETFHVGLASVPGNAAIVAALRDVNSRIRLLRVHDFKQQGRIASTIREHLEIVDAVIAGDPDRSATLLRAHIDLSASVVEQRVGEVLSQAFELEDPR